MNESYSVIHPRNPKTGTRMPRYTITKNKTGWQHETECHIEELADDLAKLDVRLLELENKINNLFNLHVAFMKIMATELASVRVPQGRPAHKVVTPAPDATHGKDC